MKQTCVESKGELWKLTQSSALASGEEKRIDKTGKVLGIKKS